MHFMNPVPVMEPGTIRGITDDATFEQIVAIVETLGKTSAWRKISWLYRQPDFAADD